MPRRRPDEDAPSCGDHRPDRQDGKAGTWAAVPDAFAALSLEDLRGRHLGRCARRILLLAPGPADEPRVLPPERLGRSAAESHRRAMRRLAAIGLVELSSKIEQVQTKRKQLGAQMEWDANAGMYREAERHRIPVQRSVEKRAVRLTVAGALLVDRLRPTLETGKRIRWTKVIEQQST